MVAGRSAGFAGFRPARHKSNPPVIKETTTAATVSLRTRIAIKNQILIQDRECHTRLHEEWKLVDLLERFLDKRCRAWLESDYERKPGSREARLLENRIYVNSGFREDGCQRGDDAGFVLYHEAKVVAGGEVGADRE